MDETVLKKFYDVKVEAKQQNFMKSHVFSFQDINDLAASHIISPKPIWLIVIRFTTNFDNAAHKIGMIYLPIV